MTPNEHMLMLLLVMKQKQAIRILLDILKSNGILSGDDERAFDFSQSVNAPSNAALFDEAKAVYVEIAKSLGIHTGLETLPQFPTDLFRPPSP